MEASIADVESKLAELNLLVYGDVVKTGVSDALAALPKPEDCPDASLKVRVLVARARARLLLPAFSKEAEADMNKALKLKPKDTAAWVVMSEVYWKRNALRESKDALNSALRLDPKHVAALCQLSRVLRSQCAAKDLSSEEKAKLMEESVAKAKEAVAVDMTNGEAWLAMGVGVLQQAVSTGMDLTLLRRALQGLTQAVKHSPQNPDAHYNRAVALRCMGHYGTAVEEFQHALRLDGVGLQSAKNDIASILLLLKKHREAEAVMKAPANERELKKNVIGSLPGAERSSHLPFTTLSEVVSGATKGTDAKPVWVSLKIVELVSAETDQPLAFTAVDKQGDFCALLVYRLLPTGLKPGNVVFVPFPLSGVAQHVHKVHGTEQPVLTVVAEPTTVFVDGAPIGAKHYMMPMLATRQFQ